jgi:hypothetical protein
MTTESTEEAPEQTFAESIAAYEAANSDWLSDSHAPLLVALRLAARRLDAGDDKVTLLGNFTQTFSRLQQQALPKTDADEDDDLLGPVEA